MAWTAPRTWVDDELVTTAYMNAQIRDNLLVLSTHTHGGSAGDGSATLASGISFSGLGTVTFADQSGDPSTTGRLQRNGNNLVYYNGSAAVGLGSADASAGTASLRTLGTGATAAAAGNHTHTPTTPSTSALTGSDITTTSAAISGTFKKAYTSGQTLDGTSKAVTPTLANNLVIISCYAVVTDSTGFGKILVKQTVGGSETTILDGLTVRFYQRVPSSTIGLSFSHNLIELTDRSVAEHTYHLEVDDSVDIWGAYLMATVVEA